jgi:hypothetical protein
MKTYAMFEIAFRAPVQSVFGTGGVPCHGGYVVLAAVEVRGGQHVVLEVLIIGVARAGRCWRGGHCDNRGGDICELCAGEEEERNAHWEEMHREVGKLCLLYEETNDWKWFWMNVESMI